jgi:hypothetical protein
MKLLLTLIPFVVLLGTDPVMSFDTTKLGQMGTLLTSRTVPLSGKSVRLREEVKRALADSKRDGVMCIGMRFPGQWVHLGGERVAPYACDFGGKWLKIEAHVRIVDQHGRVFERITLKAMRKSTRVIETNPRWKWTHDYPFESE